MYLCARYASPDVWKDLFDDRISSHFLWAATGQVKRLHHHLLPAHPCACSLCNQQKILLCFFFFRFVNRKNMKQQSITLATEAGCTVSPTVGFHLKNHHVKVQKRWKIQKIVPSSSNYFEKFHIRGWSLNIRTNLNIQTSIAQKLGIYKWTGWYFAKLIIIIGDHFGKRTA